MSLSFQGATVQDLPRSSMRALISWLTMNRDGILSRTVFPFLVPPPGFYYLFSAVKFLGDCAALDRFSALHYFNGLRSRQRLMSKSECDTVIIPHFWFYGRLSSVQIIFQF